MPADERDTKAEATAEIQEGETPPTPAPESNPDDLITKANEAASRLEASNKELASLLERQERLQVEQTLGGSTTAGTVKQTKEQKAIANAKKFLEGTGYEDMFDTPKPPK